MSKSHFPFLDKIGLEEYNNAFLRYNSGSSTQYTRREANFGHAGLAGAERRLLSVPGLQSKGQGSSLSPEE